MKDQLVTHLFNTIGALTLEDVLLNFLAAAVIAAVIFISYRVSHSNALYSARFNVTLVMLTLVTTLVMSVIGNNVALSLGMVGALSIIRFRTPIKDPRDAAYIFWCIAGGICCGVSEFMIAAVGSAVIFAMMLIFGFVHNNERYLIVVRGQKGKLDEIESVMEATFHRGARLRVRNTSPAFEEYIYEIPERVLNEAKKKGDVVAYLNGHFEADAINIICQNDEINR